MPGSNNVNALVQLVVLMLNGSQNVALFEHVFIGLCLVITAGVCAHLDIN